QQGDTAMDAKTVRETAYAMPLTAPAYPRGGIRFLDRETLTITYETDLELLRRVVPEPLEVVDPIVNFEVIHMPDSSGLGDYSESGQVIQVHFEGQTCSYVHMMYLNDLPGIVAGRERFGFPKKWGHPKLAVQEDSLVGTLDYAATRVATATMGFKHETLDIKAVEKATTAARSFLLKIIPDVDDTPRVCELVEYGNHDVTVKGAWTGPAALALVPHALAPLADLPVRRIISAQHTLMDITLDTRKVVHNYLSNG
ncbi:MAG: acetoacetate decarboxylase, partial [Hyphomicrobiaceae bacterium]